MGNKASTKKESSVATTTKQEVEKEDEEDEVSDSEDEGDTEEQASPFLDLQLHYELPGGTSELKTVRFDASMKVSVVKSIVETLFNIPPNKAQIFRHNGKVNMPNHKNLLELQVQSNQVFRVRNAALNYD